MRDVKELSTLDEFLVDEGDLEVCEAAAIERVLAWQLKEAMRAKKLTKTALAEQMHTSRTQINRLLGGDSNVTLSTLQRAAQVLGHRLQISLV
jgi:DNA-binding Xre family transcriptional regulator